MAMNGIGQFDHYHNYQSINAQGRENRVPEEKPKAVSAGTSEAESAQRTEMPLSLNLEGIYARHDMSLSDVRLSMEQPGSASVDRKALTLPNGSDDLNRAISDMQRDPALMQYSYFVGESNVILDNEDGIVLRK